MAEWKLIATNPPPYAESVLIFLPEGNKGLPGCEVAQWWGEKPPGQGEPEECWWTNGGPNGGDDRDDFIAATHWMPLPEFPPHEATPDAT